MKYGACDLEQKLINFIIGDTGQIKQIYSEELFLCNSANEK